jgi:hypothetical protein
VVRINLSIRHVAVDHGRFRTAIHFFEQNLKAESGALSGNSDVHKAE